MVEHPSSLAEWLPTFFERWPKKFQQPSLLDTSLTSEINSAQLSAFLSRLQPTLEPWQHRELQFDPWEVVGLKRKEVLNSSVLAWLLDPQGSHGFGHLALTALLNEITDKKSPYLPSHYERYCQVCVETNPTGDIKNRVDIEIDADTFYLLIEVKIDAAEGQKQLLRYCEEAKSRAGGRPWAVAFLTPDGRASLTGVQYNPSPHIPCLSWRKLASAIEFSLLPHLRRTSTGHSPMRDAAQHAALCFLKRMRHF